MLSIPELQKFIDEASSRRLRTPYMLTDLNIVREHCRVFKRSLPGVKLYYAVKCFDDPQVLRAASPLVDGFDVASIKEIECLIDCGVNPSRITFSNPVKSEEAIKKASELGAKKFAFQSLNELMKITKSAPRSEVYVRIKMGDSKGAIPFSAKFGCPPEEAIRLLKAALQLGLRPTGITFHIGSQSSDLRMWERAIVQAQGILEEAQRNGLTLHTINLGGGFPVQYSSRDHSFEEVASVVEGRIRKGSSEIAYIAEPGRYLTADSSVIVASIIGVEEREARDWLYLDVGTFHAFMEVFEFGSFPYPVYSLTHLQRRVASIRYKNYVLTGPTCDAYDTMALEVKLPSDMSVGDKLLITMAGAYTTVYGSEFNGFRVPPHHFVSVPRARNVE